jgi:hypothetical protein
MGLEVLQASGPLKKKALCSFATSETGYPLMQCNVPDDENPLNHSDEDFKTSKLRFA